ncbi:MAG: Pathogenicity locus [Oscillibacter sp.]|nr:helix-hairpin-helix domain-containing protein [uncultured Oscillibacter sp.]MCI8970695.1 Pathogenicity locus [Oscillibacter sp.]
MNSPLTEIPGVGTRIAAVMEALGLRQVSDLRGRDPEELYLKECLMKGYQEDRCALYVWRAAVYYADHPDRDPEKLKWWYWKDKPYPEKEDL